MSYTSKKFCFGMQILKDILYIFPAFFEVV